jgi:hypothetical protein
LAPKSLRLKQLSISAFLLVHLGGLAVWNMPICPIRDRLVPVYQYYMCPLGLWQNWTMFAPEPVKNTTSLQAIAVDKNGFMYQFAFPKMVDFSWLEGVTRVRHSKFAANVGTEGYPEFREIAARHVVRALELPPEVFPVDVEVQYLVKMSPPPGTVPDPMVVPIVHPIKAFRFPTWQEARP